MHEKWFGGRKERNESDDVNTHVRDSEEKMKRILHNDIFSTLSFL